MKEIVIQSYVFLKFRWMLMEFIQPVRIEFQSNRFKLNYQISDSTERNRSDTLQMSDIRFTERY